MVNCSIQCWSDVAAIICSTVLWFLVFLVYLLECVSGIGSDYRGTKSKTKTGKTCQSWESKFPHRPKYVHTFLCCVTWYALCVYVMLFVHVCCSITPQTHPLADLESNLCRNPDGDSGGPWCYTTDPSTRWEHCDVADCTGEAHSWHSYLYLLWLTHGLISLVFTPNRGVYSLQWWGLQRKNLHHWKWLHLPTLGLAETPQPWIHSQRVRCHSEW